MQKFLRNQGEDIETNQDSIGMKYIFRGILIKAWTGENFAMIKYTMLNRIIAKYCMNFYMECWTNRNLKLHDKDE